MGFANYADPYVIDDAATAHTAEWQLVIEADGPGGGITVIYLGAGDDVEFWKGECVRLYGIWPSVFEKGNFVEVEPRG